MRVAPTYTVAADVWGLGVNVLECMGELPYLLGQENRLVKGSGLNWCFRIAQKVDGMPETPLTILLRKMLCIEPTIRLTARACAAAASEILEGLQPPLPPQHEIGPGYHIWTSNEVQVAYTADSINATKLVKLGGSTRYEMVKFTTRYPAAKKNTVGGRGYTQGTYIWLTYASAFCDHVGIPPNLRHGMPLPPEAAPDPR